MSDNKVKDHYDESFLIDDEDEDTQANKYLTFNLGKESYGLDIKYVIEIIELQKIIEIPDMPDFVRGVINLRGQVIPLVELRTRFNIEKREYDDRTCIIIVDVNKMPVGLIVDRVEEVLNIMKENIQPPPHFKTASGKEQYISGLGKIGDEIKILLSVERILYQEELQVIKENLSINSTSLESTIKK